MVSVSILKEDIIFCRLASYFFLIYFSYLSANFQFNLVISSSFCGADGLITSSIIWAVHDAPEQSDCSFFRSFRRG